MRGRNWTEKDVQDLVNMIGVYKLKTIARKLDRTEKAIITKINKLKLGPISSYREGITANELATACNVSHSTVMNWISKKKLKCKKSKLLEKQYYYLIKIDDFWSWAYENQDSVKFSNIEHNILGKEPGWVVGARREELNNKSKLKKNKKWTKREDDLLRMMVGKYTYKEIADRLERTPGAIKLRIKRIGLSRRTRIEWDETEVKTLKELNSQGLSKYKIADILARHPSNIYQKLSSLEI